MQLSHAGFFERAGPFTLRQIAEHVGARPVGCVVIGEDVEIGANTTIDRGTLTATVIGDGTKIDNLVQIAHNVVIGRHCIIVAQGGIAGSAELGDYVVMAPGPA